MNNLASAYQAVGKLDLALPLFEQALDKRKTKLGPNHPDTQKSLRNLADCCAKLQQPEKAEPLLRQLTQFWKEKAGADSTQYAGQLAALGLNLLQKEKPADAEPLLRECLLICQKKQPDESPTFHTISLLGGSLLGQKNYSDAEPLLLAGYEGMKQREAQLSPEGKSRLTEALQRLVDLYDALGQKDNADEWRKQQQALKAPKPTDE